MSIQYYYSKFFKKIRGSAIKRSQIHKKSRIESGCNIVNVIMDRYSYCGYDCEISNCEIGAFTSIANGVIIGGGMHSMTWVGMSPVFFKGRDSVKKKFSKFEREPVKKTFIGHDAWIGQNALIKQRVRIGNGAVMGMSSVVTKDIKPYSIVVDNPARLIRMRFDNQLIEQLEEAKWWSLSEDKLSQVSHLIKNPEQFLKNI